MTAPFRVLVGLLAWLVPMSSGLGEDSKLFLLVTELSNPEYLERLSEGCNSGLDPAGEYRCELVFPIHGGGTPEVVQRTQDLLQTANVAAALIQSDADLALALAGGGRLMEAGVPIIGWSSTTLERGSGLGELATTLVGVSQQQLVDELLAELPQEPDNPSACVLTFEGSDRGGLLLSQVNEALPPRGFEPVCTSPSPSFKSMLDMILAQGGAPPAAVIVPYYLTSTALDALSASLGKLTPAPLDIAGGADPFILAQVAAEAGLKAIMGEAIENRIFVSSAIQAGTSEFCTSCDCQNNDRCKRDCLKCKS